MCCEHFLYNSRFFSRGAVLQAFGQDKATLFFKLHELQTCSFGASKVSGVSRFLELHASWLLGKTQAEKKLNKSSNRTLLSKSWTKPDYALWHIIHFLLLTDCSSRTCNCISLPGNTSQIHELGIRTRAHARTCTHLFVVVNSPRTQYYTLGRPRGATDRRVRRHAVQRVRHFHLQPDRDSHPGVLEAFAHFWGVRDHRLERKNDRGPRHRNGGWKKTCFFSGFFVFEDWERRRGGRGGRGSER